MGTRGLTLAICLLAIAGCERAPLIDNSRHAPAIRRLIGSTPTWVDRGKVGTALWRTERDFYASRRERPAWMDGDHASPRVAALIDALKHAEDHGLDPANYQTDTFEQMAAVASQNRGRYDIAQVPEIDAKLTYAYLRYAADLLGWTGNPKAFYPTWIVGSNKVDLKQQLATAVSGNVHQTLEELAPTHSQYKGLQAALRRERQSPDGHLDAILMNLARWRWMPRDLGDRYVLVNVPAYQMQVIDNGHPVIAMRVVVGDPKHPTPLFSDEMTTVVFSPRWNVPESIIRKEMVPKLVDDPDFLDRQSIEVIGTSGELVDTSEVDWGDEEAVSGLHFRQEPGPKNALGLVKFLFPNQFDVYLHDTPADSLFNKPQRALSHGCVRLENPVALAQYVLRDRPEWTAQRISAAMNAGQEQGVPLKKHLPVHIAYLTAWVNADGSVTYTDDPYQLDAKQKGQPL